MRKKLYNEIYRAKLVQMRVEKKSKARCFEGAIFFSSEGVAGSPPLPVVSSAILCGREEVGKVDLAKVVDVI